MSYLWQEFNIKTFEAETLVFKDGFFCPELSDYENIDFNNNLISINKTPKLPIHIIYIGEISGDINLNIDINSVDTNIIMTMKILCKKPTFLNIFVKNKGKNSIFDGKIIIKNYDLLKMNIKGTHYQEKTNIYLKTKVAAYKNSKNYLEGTAEIEKNTLNCDSDISFSVLADENTLISISPKQYISSVPEKASHSASIYKPKDNQIYYLKTSGLSSDEVKSVLEQSFLEE